MGGHQGNAEASSSVTTLQDGLRKTKPYWYEFQTYAKLRWFGRELIEIMTTEFRDRTKEYYVWAIHKGICTINGQKADIQQIVGDGDKICNSVHRHEPPVTDEPIKIIHRDDDEGILVIVKPGSIPVHAAGRYLRHTLTGLLNTEHGIEMVYTTNRLDRLTSGIMVCSTKKETASRLGAQFAAGQVSKAYVCRVRGQFPEGEIVCKEPILTIDRQSGVNIVHPKGKYCETIFVRLSYDADTDSSVVFCRPITGRTHQIRVHVQYLGHPICNDPIYGHDVWSKVDQSSFAEVIPDQWKKVGGEIGQKEVEMIVNAIKGDQDGQEDWARWKDEVLFKDMIAQEGLENVHVPGPNGRSSRPSDELLKRALQKLEDDKGEVPAKGLNRPADIETAWQKRVREQSSDFCPECKIPLLPDPRPEELYIYLHAIKYWTDEWSFEDALPWWAREDWKSISPHGSGTREGAAEATLPQGLAVAHTTGAELSGGAISTLITSEIEEKASRLADPQKYAKQDQGVELTQLRQLVDFPPNDIVSTSRTSSTSAATASINVPVVFQVFGGFEDFAQREILQQTLARASQTDAALTPRQATSSSIHSGHVRVLDDQLARHGLEAYFDAKLGIAKTAYLLTAIHEFPRDLAKELKHEKFIGGASKRARWKAKELRKVLAKKEGKKLGTQPTTPGLIEKPSILRQDGDATDVLSTTVPDTLSLTEQQGADSQAISVTAAVNEMGISSPASEAEMDEGAPFPSEVKLLKLIDTVWESSLPQLDAALASWTRITEATTSRPLIAASRTYRATVDRATYNLPSLNSQTMERYVGELAWDWLNGLNTPPSDTTNWKVDLEQPMLDITLKFFPGFGIGDEFEKELAEDDDPALKSEGQIAFMVKLPSPVGPNPRRPAGRNALLVGGTTMAEYRAASLALALPLPTKRKTSTDVQEGETLGPLRILEPCCGHGSLVFETAAMLEARGLTGEVLGGDIDEETVARAQQISDLAGFSPCTGPVKVTLRGVDGTDKASLSHFVGGTSSIDAILTDLPWGKREKSAQSLSKLYHLFIESWFPVLRTGGYIVAVTAEHKTLSRALGVFETTCRKKRVGSCLVMEDVRMLDADAKVGEWEEDKVKRQGVLEAKRNAGMRKIEIGYHVYVFLIRKIAI
ncbi:Pseudouridine synthase, RsuA/RluB/C/D/E/F [Kalmanozyma brasiliensis GHG001]|uniref:RNA pseudouridylate synthase n=1 Tax=Kalmanozyma brasiliensis (strain GHG001) TaxID=1365824 RepID=V5EJ77_KALBG|nr:Pseudouridine synthase, RsuA/RluB/C/D/E/F [Kalmanozyma brasiliensis GHG001]EST04785.1 Pseudouridine synthase, RsuA/RluB/C/D/E/F [Kalmanozyma brasiliensis GHG001]